MGFLMMHRSTRELLVAASFYEKTRVKQDDINILELWAVQAAAGMMMAVRAAVHEHSLKTKVAACTHSWEGGNR